MDTKYPACGAEFYITELQVTPAEYLDQRNAVDGMGQIKQGRVVLHYGGSTIEILEAIDRIGTPRHYSIRIDEGLRRFGSFSVAEMIYPILFDHIDWSLAWVDDKRRLEELERPVPLIDPGKEDAADKRTRELGLCPPQGDFTQDVNVQARASENSGER